LVRKMNEILDDNAKASLLLVNRKVDFLEDCRTSPVAISFQT